MEQFIIKPRVWECPNCKYFQDKDPYDPEIMWHEDWFPDCPLGCCPNCYFGRRGMFKMGVGSVDYLPQTITVASDSDIIAQPEAVLDESGQQLQVEVGRQDHFQVDPNTGKSTNVGLPVLEDVTRERTDEEIKSEVETRDRMLDELAPLQAVDGIADAATSNEKEEIAPETGDAYPLLHPGLYKVRDILARAGVSSESDLSNVQILSNDGALDLQYEGDAIDLKAGMIAVTENGEVLSEMLVR